MRGETKGVTEADRTSFAQPRVSVVIPCRNEAEHLDTLLAALEAQDYPHERMEILIADGRSDDGTPEIVGRWASRLPVRLLDNPARITPSALNIAIAASTGEIIVRLDGHCEPAPDYVTRCVSALEQSGAGCVGGLWETVGTTSEGRAIAFAQSRRFGVGNAVFRTGASAAGPVDTVPFGAFRRQIFDEVGMFDEELIRNQDDELNFRLVQAGHTIWLDPAIRVRYFSRLTLSKLWHQYFEYGMFKVRVMQKRRGIASWRHVVPAGFVVAAGAASVAALGRRPKPLAALIALYGGAAAVAARDADEARHLVMAAFATMHVSYGTGFLKGAWRWRSSWR